MKKIAVFAAGRGSNFKQLCKSIKEKNIPAEIALLIASKPGIGALDIAAEYGIEAQVFQSKEYAGSEPFNRAILKSLQAKKIDFIALAGWLKLIHSSVINAFPNRIINIHPALLPFFGGKGMYGHHVHQAVYDSGMLVSGATVHLVDPEYDRGGIILQKSVQLDHADDPEAIAAKVLKVEHEIYPIALKWLVEEKIKIKDKKVFILKDSQ